MNQKLHERIAHFEFFVPVFLFPLFVIMIMSVRDHPLLGIGLFSVMPTSSVQRVSNPGMPCGFNNVVDPPRCRYTRISSAQLRPVLGQGLTPPAITTPSQVTWLTLFDGYRSITDVKDLRPITGCGSFVVVTILKT